MKDKNQDQLKDIAPRLAQLREHLPTPKPPVGYWENMTDSLMDKIHQEPQSTGRVVGLRRKPIYWMGLAASLLLLLAAAWWISLEPQGEGATVATTWEDISTEEVQSYVFNNIEDFELDWFVQEELDPMPNYDLDAESIESFLEEDINLEDLEDMGELF